MLGPTDGWPQRPVDRTQSHFSVAIPPTADHKSVDLRLVSTGPLTSLPLACLAVHPRPRAIQPGPARPSMFPSSQPLPRNDALVRGPLSWWSSLHGRKILLRAPGPENCGGSYECRCTVRMVWARDAKPGRVPDAMARIPYPSGTLDTNHDIIG